MSKADEPFGQHTEDAAGAEPEEAGRVVDDLAGLFRDHPAWREAAAMVSAASESDVYFATRPGEAWHLRRREGETCLEPGRSADPDLVFRFTPAAVRRLARVRGGIGEFADALFTLLENEDPALRVDLRVVASFTRLLRRGYVRLLARAGPEALAHGLKRGVTNLSGLRRLIRLARSAPPFDWEI